jgi:hypothetical protein
MAAQLGATWLVWQPATDVADAPPEAFSAGRVRIYHLVAHSEAGA